MDYGQYEGRTSADILKERPDGNCFATVVRAANHRNKSAYEPTAPLTVFVRQRATCWLFRVGISFGYWPPVDRSRCLGSR